MQDVPMHEQVSLLSYNILYPNTEGWWIKKYYPFHESPEVSSWSYRKHHLLNQLHRSEADIICLQETASSSFQEDFAGLDSVYDRVVHAKGMSMRCATFWRKKQFDLVEVKHKYRSLLTLLRSSITAKSLLIINVHLSGGPYPKKRLDQVHQALKYGHKILKNNLTPDDKPRLILCGDFNVNISESALGQFLAHGSISPDDRDFDHPDVVLTSKVKHHAFAPLRHASCVLDSTTHRGRTHTKVGVDCVFGHLEQTQQDKQRLNSLLKVHPKIRQTLQVPNLIHHFCHHRINREDELVSHSLKHEVLQARRKSMDSFRSFLKPDFYVAMRQIFERFADKIRHRTDDEMVELSITYSSEGSKRSGELVMSDVGAARWLQMINGALRGSEYETWRTLSRLQVDHCLTFAQWVEIAIAELKSGKWWSVAYDMQVCGVPWPSLNLGQSPLHCEWLDHIVFGGSLSPVSWCESPLFVDLEARYTDGRPLPHRDHPSDHLPVQATFTLT